MTDHGWLALRIQEYLPGWFGSSGSGSTTTTKIPIDTGTITSNITNQTDAWMLVVDLEFAVDFVETTDAINAVQKHGIIEGAWSLFLQDVVPVSTCMNHFQMLGRR